MQQPAPPLTIVASAPNNSSFSSSSPLALLQLSRTRLLALALLVAGLLGGAATIVETSATYDATAQATIPVPITVSDDSILHAAERRLKLTGPEARTVSLRTEQFPSSQLLVATATASHAGVAARVANAAVDIVASRDQALWAKQFALRSHAEDADPAALQLAADEPLARIVQSASLQEADKHSELRFSPRRSPGALLCVACCALASGILWLLPRNGQIERPQTRMFRFSRNARRNRKSEKTVPTGATDLDLSRLPVVAGILLAPDLTAGVAGAVRPVLMDVDASLWTLFTDEATGLRPLTPADESQTGAGRELLLTRLGGDSGGRGSRSAMLALGRALAARGLKTLLIDADLAGDPAQRYALGLPDDAPGIAQILARQNKVEDCLLVDEDEHPGLSALPAGLGVLTAKEAERRLESAEFLDLLDLLGADHDAVLIHGPSANASAPAIAARADATLIVVPEHHTGIDKRAAIQALSDLSTVQANILGRVELCSSAFPTLQTLPRA